MSTSPVCVVFQEAQKVSAYWNVNFILTYTLIKIMLRLWASRIEGLGFNSQQEKEIFLLRFIIRVRTALDCFLRGFVTYVLVGDLK
jgi:hypothetical protein